jgi:hypothetical protein
MVGAEVKRHSLLLMQPKCLFDEILQLSLPLNLGDLFPLHESVHGTDRQFAAAQRCVSYQRQTRHSAAAANSNGP